MQTDVLAHLDRIGAICEGMALHPAWEAPESEATFNTLTGFDQEFWTFTRYLSLPLYEETSALLLQQELSLTTAPQIAVIMAVHRPDPQLLRLSIHSALQQVAVRTHLHLSLDGPEANLAAVEEALSELRVPADQVTLHLHPDHRGVGLCRNAALAKSQEEWFTFLDCDDIFHPLRLLHAWLALKSYGGRFLNTAYSRVSLRQGKIFLLQQCLSSMGSSSFLAHRQMLNHYGYLAPLEFWEDSEYQQRLDYFKAPMLNSRAIGHYQNSELGGDPPSLSRRWLQEAHPISDHPWLCGTILGAMDAETRALRDHYLALYPQLSEDQLPMVFPPQGSNRARSLASGQNGDLSSAGAPTSAAPAAAQQSQHHC